MVQAASPPMPALNTRPGLALASVAASLGPLTDLAGTWIGKGFSLVSLPDFDSRPPRIVNMPFDIANANTTRLDASFWIETVKQADGTTFQQLQYTQTVILNFLGVNWPHISMATLTKQ